MDSLLARVVAVFGAAQPHTAYAFANQRASRMKVLMHDGFGLWLCSLHDIAALGALDQSALRTLAQSLMERIAQDSRQIGQRDAELQLRQARIDALTIEIRLLRHLRFAAKTEAMDAVQAKLFEEANAEDLAAAQQRLSQLGVKTAGAAPKSCPVRQALPPSLPRVDIAHEPADTTCGCGAPLARISQDVSERLDYVPGVFRVERHIRGVSACKCCAHLRQQAMPAQIIDAGIPTARLLAQVLISKYDDHLPLYRQGEIYERAGVQISRSTLAGWVGACAVALAPIAQALKTQLLQARVLHADESPITILARMGQKKRGCIWACASGVHEPVSAVVYQIKEGRSGQHARDFLQHGPGMRQVDQGASDPLCARRWGGRLPMDNNRIENQIRPWAIGRKSWLFSGSLAAGEGAADIMSLIQTAKMNGIEPLACLTDVLTRLPTHPNSRIAELLPTRWQPLDGVRQ